MRKLERQAAESRLGVPNNGGIVFKAIRQMAINRNLAEIANKKKENKSGN